MNKILILCLFTVFSSQAYSRQYIQCALGKTSHRMVINLNPIQSTLMLVNGVHLPQPKVVLKKLFIKKVKKNNIYLKSEKKQFVERIIIPGSAYNKALQYFTVSMSQIDLKKKRTYRTKWACFSSIHSD